MDAKWWTQTVLGVLLLAADGYLAFKELSVQPLQLHLSHMIFVAVIALVAITMILRDDFITDMKKLLGIVPWDHIPGAK